MSKLKKKSSIGYKTERLEIVINLCFSLLCVCPNLDHNQTSLASYFQWDSQSVFDWHQFWLHNSEASPDEYFSRIASFQHKIIVAFKV